jgi:anionic cell wall polymer biosynthesis LytR-Cps2A-Psr (LCP) family protein
MALGMLMPANSVFAAATPFDAPGMVMDFADVLADLAQPVLPIARGLDGTASIDYGSDGRLTFLLLGLDSRTTSVTRTDTVMVMSLEGSTISAASIPRDTKRMPNPFQGGTYGKVNSILRNLYLANGRNLSTALSKFEIVIENTLGIQIDYHAVVWFNGFTTLVDQVDGGTEQIKVDISNPIYDARHHDKIGSDSNYGVYFPKATDYALFAWNPSSQTGSPYCDGQFKKYNDPSTRPNTWCKRALPFVRTRHGSSDYVRGLHQQRFIDATIDAVEFNELNGLVSTAVGTGNGKWWTNFPITMENAVELYNALQGATLGHSVVFKPVTYARKIPNQNGIELKLDVVRQWCDNWLS